jgi:hypothetical protein
MRIEEEYSDVLQNIESAIVTVYESSPELVDRDVLSAIESLAIESLDTRLRTREEKSRWRHGDAVWPSTSRI